MLVRKSYGETNLRDYPFLLENVRNSRPTVTRVPANYSRLRSVAYELAAAEAALEGKKLSRKERRKAADDIATLASLRTMLYSPLGAGGYEKEIYSG